MSRKIYGPKRDEISDEWRRMTGKYVSWAM
jgi:hypothetical protein